MIELLDSGQKQPFDAIMAKIDQDPTQARTYAFRAKPYGISDPFDLYTAVRGYQLRDVAEKIRTPLLITAPRDEQFWPHQSAELAGLLTAPHEVVQFTRQDGANLHCQPLARRLTSYRMFGWLATHLDRPGRSGPDTPAPGRHKQDPEETRRGPRDPHRR